MPLHALGDAEPGIRPDAHVHPDAVVIGPPTPGPMVLVGSRFDEGAVDCSRQPGERLAAVRRAGSGSV